MGNIERIIGEFFDPVYDSIGDIHVGYRPIKTEETNTVERRDTRDDVWTHLQAERHVLTLVVNNTKNQGV